MKKNGLGNGLAHLTMKFVITKKERISLFVCLRMGYCMQFPSADKRVYLQ